MGMMTNPKVLAGLVGLGALAPTDAEAMYIGPKAKGWKDVMGKFTALFDKKERAEISDAYSRLRPMKEVDFMGPLPGVYKAENASLQDVLSHPELFKRYPDLANKKGEMFINPSGSSEAVWLDADEIERGLNWQVYGRTPKEAHENLLHEIQHAIQEKEGWARGGSPDAMHFYPAKKVGEGNMSAYNRLSGEIEARDTAARMGLTADQRLSKQPYSSENIPLTDYLTKLGIIAPIAGAGLLATTPTQAQAVGTKNYQQMIDQQALQEPLFDPTALLAPGGLLGKLGGEGINALLKYFTGNK